MILYKRYKGETTIQKTTSEKERINLAKAYINVELTIDTLKKGQPIQTNWAWYARRKEDLP